jgi:4-amino-4-deoxy-L-arabinose transferase-like glycosyltransferase
MRWMILLVILLGILARIPELSAPPLAFHPARQYRGAILARSFYLNQMQGLTPQQVAAARAATPTDTLEPPLVEHLAAWIYQLAGHEDLRIPRLISVLAWALGAVALAWLLAQWSFSVTAVLSGASFMMLVPFGLVATPTIQPDSLMTALTVLGVALAVQYDRRPDGSGLVLLVIALGAAVFVKPMSVFFVGPVAIAALVRRHGWIRGGALAAACLLAAAAPTGIYFLTHERPQAEYGLFTQLAGQAQYWVNWKSMLDRTVGLVALAAGLAGLALAPTRARVVLACWWLGYVAFGVAFAYRVSTHDYYSLPLIPLVAASVAAFVDWI